MYEKITKTTCENGLKSLIFIAVGCFILFLFSIFEIYSVEAQTWYLIAMLAGGGAAVQRAVVALVLGRRSDEIGEHVSMSPLVWTLTFIPSIVAVVLFLILYPAAHAETGFFALDAGYFFASFGILILGIGVCYLFDFAVVAVTKKIRCILQRSKS